MQALSPFSASWVRLERLGQPTPASGPSGTQATAPQTYVTPQQGQQIGGQTLEELMRLQQQQSTPLSQNYLRQFMAPTSTNYFQQLY